MRQDALSIVLSFTVIIMLIEAVICKCALKFTVGRKVFTGMKFSLYSCAVKMLFAK